MILAIPGRIGQIKQEGRDEQNAAWVAWYQAKQDAESKGLPFTQPPPAPLRSPEGVTLQMRTLKCKNHNVVATSEPIMSATDHVRELVARKYDCPYCGVRAIEEQHNVWVVVMAGKDVQHGLKLGDEGFPFEAIG